MTVTVLATAVGVGEDRRFAHRDAEGIQERSSATPIYVSRDLS
ncbi:hypothetical protein ACFWRG_20020 [Micromonospora tulbaghiae]